jgi:tetratricopeptide (TPR) repeat protein
MPLKKKTLMPKIPEKRNAPTAAQRENANGQGEARTAGSTPPGVPRGQMAAFEDGMRLLHARQFQQAREQFMAAAGGPDRAVTDRASLHARICATRLGPTAVVLDTPEDHYNYAITLINSRDLPGALQHLRTALESNPTADHVLYALAVSQGLAGDVDGAYENLKRAIDLQPRNRLAARQDPDFAAVADRPAFARLLFPDKK